MESRRRFIEVFRKYPKIGLPTAQDCSQRPSGQISFDKIPCGTRLCA
jgi:hypothetical protein